MSKGAGGSVLLQAEFSMAGDLWKDRGLEAGAPNVSQLFLDCLWDQRGVTALLFAWFLHLQHYKAYPKQNRYQLLSKGRLLMSELLV